MIDVKIAGDFSADGVAVWVSRRFGDQRRQVLHAAAGGAQAWEDVGISEEIPPTLHLEDDAARALLDALLAYYQGPPDLHTVRSDLLHERGRVDLLIGVVTEIAGTAVRTGPPG